MTNRGCPAGHLQPRPDECKLCNMAVNKDHRYFKRWFGEDVPEPSLLNRVVNFTGAVFNHVVTGMKEVDQQVYEQRVTTCKACAKYDSETKKCKMCGCYLGGGILDKARWKEQKCPLKLWEE